MKICINITDNYITFTVKDTAVNPAILKYNVQ